MTSPADMSQEQVREHTYGLWREHGQNIQETVKTLAAEGFKVSRQTVAAWRDKYTWGDRAARAEATAGEIDDLTSDNALLMMASKQLLRYDAYFDSLPATKTDNQAMFAFNGLVKTVFDMKHHKATVAPVSAIPPVLREVNTPEDAIEALQDAIEANLNTVLTDPARMSLKQAKEVRDSLALLDDLKARYKASDGKVTRQGLEDNDAEQIRRQIMGLEA